MAQNWGQVIKDSDERQVIRHVGTGTKLSLVPKTSHRIGYHMQSTMIFSLRQVVQPR